MNKGNLASDKLNLAEKILSKDIQADDMINLINAISSIGGNIDVE